MNKWLFVTVILFTTTILSFAQPPDMELAFTAVNNTDWEQLDSIRVINRSQGVDTLLYYPDTLLPIYYYYVGVTEPVTTTSGFQVFQNYPNPVAGHTHISLYIPGRGRVGVTVSDLAGRAVIRMERELDAGVHTFRFTPGPGDLYLFSASWDDQVRSIKMLSVQNASNRVPSLDYAGCTSPLPSLRSSAGRSGFVFTPGDTLIYAGYAGGLESGISDVPQQNTSYTFQFATNIPCPGTPTVDYEGKVYNTIQVFSQCWLKENLDAGNMIPGAQGMTDNGVIEKYCYHDEPDSCNKYGGLYQWDEMMQYIVRQGAQGICPPGWHIPSDEEWKILEGAVDSLYGIGDPVWDLFSSIDRGYDDGTNLKSVSGWKLNGNGADLFGFTALPSGYLDHNGQFGGINYFGELWTSTPFDEDDAWYRSLYWDPIVDRDADYKTMAVAVRCIRD